jgi:dihydroceramide fatty acyl 2-hydroxylase
MSLFETEAAREEGRGPDRTAELSASPRLFDNPLLDKLSRVPWWTPLVVYAPVIAALGWVSLHRLGPLAAVAAATAGYAIWTLTEYLGHRFLFHAQLPGRLGARIHFLIHGVHHVHPSDPLRLVMPPLLSGPIMLIALIVARFVFGPVLGYPMLMGFVAGYIGYDLTHYFVHHGRPKGALGRMVQRNHLMHHFRDSERGFGVSAPYWDHAFGTAHRRKGGAASA